MRWFWKSRNTVGKWVKKVQTRWAKKYKQKHGGQETRTKRRSLNRTCHCWQLLPHSLSYKVGIALSSSTYLLHMCSCFCKFTALYCSSFVHMYETCTCVHTKLALRPSKDTRWVKCSLTMGRMQFCQQRPCLVSCLAHISDMHFLNYLGHDHIKGLKLLWKGRTGIDEHLFKSWI